MERTKAQESRAAIERLYIVMRHLFYRGYYKPFGESGNAIINSLRTLSPEIYGSMNDPVKLELDGLAYVMERLPKGIESCKFINLCSDEGIANANFPKLIPAKRRRVCYRIDSDQMLIEVTRGRSEIYDILTHLTFLIIESKKISRNILDSKGRLIREWKCLEELLSNQEKLNSKNENIALTYLSSIIGRSFDETNNAYHRFNKMETSSSLFQIVYWMGKLGIEESTGESSRLIKFSPALRERIGHHIYGERWAFEIKSILLKHNLQNRPIHVISSNLHSVLNCIYAMEAMRDKNKKNGSLKELSLWLNKAENRAYYKHIHDYALKSGMIEMKDTFGTNVGVQIYDLEKVNYESLPSELNPNTR